jgi:4-carboxymuconolactone decarboxylase
MMYADADPTTRVKSSAETSASTSIQAEIDVRTVSPVLERYLQTTLLGDLWKRPELSPRDRSIVTLGALIARNQTIELPLYLNLALDQGVTAAEISEIIAHLAFYSGWGECHGRGRGHAGPLRAARHQG